MFAEDSISLVSGFLLLCLFILGAWTLNRIIGKYGKHFQKGRYMKVVDLIQIAQDRQLFILQLEKENRCLLLGSGPEGINLITELKEEYEEVESVMKGRSIQDFIRSIGGKKEGDFSGIFQSLNAKNADRVEGEGSRISERRPDE